MRAVLLVVLVSLASAGCGEDEAAEIAPGVSAEAARSVADGHARLARVTYGLAVDRAQDLDHAIGALVLAPTETALDAARRAWREARQVYGLTEVFRFYGGPIDHAAAGVERWINAWPVDEAAIDAGIEGANGGRDVVGFNAIAYLLWGRGPAGRPASAFRDETRATRLVALSARLVEHLVQVRNAWTPTDEEERYVSAWRHLDPREALARTFVGLVTLAGEEVAGRRLRGVWETGDPLRVYARYSGDTRADLSANLRGIENAYDGRHGQINKPALDTLVVVVDPALDREIKRQFESAQVAFDALPASFAEALRGDDEAPGRAAIKGASDEMLVLAGLLSRAARALGVPMGS